MSVTSHEHGATPVPVPSAAAPFTVVPQPDPHDDLRPIEPREPLPPVQENRRALVELVRQPVRRGATVPVVGWEGGVGRTTLTRMLAAAFAHLRGEDPVMVDAVPVWGALSAGADRWADYCPSDLAAMPWPIPAPVLPRLMTTVGGLPLLAAAPPDRGVPADPRATVVAVRRIALLARMTFVDTVADAGGSAAELIRDPASTVVWVASATRNGLWGIGEALRYHHAVGAEHIARRSVVAVVGGHRRWPSDAAAAEAQLTGLGVETVRIPHSAKPLTDSRCRAGAERLLAAVVARSRPDAVPKPEREKEAR
jgi:hypothetical protein